MISVKAIRIVQPSGRDVFTFAATADVILRMTEVPHIGRNAQCELVGYQRPEVAAHIAEIRRYLDSDESVLPNTIVIAFRDCLTFIPDERYSSTGEFGELRIQMPTTGERVGFVVDGQQRLAAIATCRHSDFPFFVTAIMAPSVREQRKQFVLVNRTKPLPQGMIYELLPEIDGHLPQYLLKQQHAATLVARLNLDPSSSLYRRVKTPTCPVGFIKDNSLRRAMLNSLTDGALHGVMIAPHGDGDAVTAMWRLVSDFWDGVSRLFPDAWGQPPNRSRLTHGVGVVAMGYAMDDIFSWLPTGIPWAPEYVEEVLRPLIPHCAWTEGKWRFSDRDERPWNELQNTDRDVRTLANHIRSLLSSGKIQRL